MRVPWGGIQSCVWWSEEMHLTAWLTVSSHFCSPMAPHPQHSQCLLVLGTPFWKSRRTVTHLRDETHQNHCLRDQVCLQWVVLGVFGGNINWPVILRNLKKKKKNSKLPGSVLRRPYYILINKLENSIWFTNKHLLTLKKNSGPDFTRNIRVYQTSPHGASHGKVVSCA